MLNYRIGIITMPVSRAGIVPLSNLITIICSISKIVFLITGDEGFELFSKDERLKTFRISHIPSSFFIKRIFNYLLIQIKISSYIFTTRKQIDSFIFFHAGETLLLPILIARLFRKKILLFYAGSSVKTHTSKHDPLVFGLKIFQFISCTIVDKIIVYADCIISDYDLERWIGKIIIARPHYVDFYSFKIKKEYFNRDCIIGYIGRFSEEKGILQLLYAISDIVIKKSDIKIFFIGDGALRHTIEHYIRENNLGDKIILVGWVSHNNLADYLNQMKLLVIPSETEGLPNIMLEAMACGTPVLATSVGGISTVIKDGETGFIIDNNSPYCISSNINRILNHKKIKTVIENAQKMIKNEFRLEKRVEEFKVIFDDVL